MSIGSSLGDGEQVRLDLHPHWHSLVLPIVALVVTVGLASYLFFLVPHGSVQWPLRWVIVGVAVAVLGWWVVRPWLRWLTTRYVVTTRRVMIRRGLVRRHGRDIPMSRINDVSFDCTLVERMLRCGTLTIESAGEHGQIALGDVPGVEHVQRTIYALAEQENARLGPRATGSPWAGSWGASY